VAKANSSFGLFVKDYEWPAYYEQTSSFNCTNISSTFYVVW